MRKSNTHFEQISVELVKKIAAENASDKNDGNNGAFRTIGRTNSCCGKRQFPFGCEPLLGLRTNRLSDKPSAIPFQHYMYSRQQRLREGRCFVMIVGFQSGSM